MVKPIPKFYWDACCWLGLINNESGKHKELRAIWEAAKRGQCEIYTSAYTFIEVVKAKTTTDDPISIAESDQRIDDLLGQPFVCIIQLDSIIGKLARRLRRSFPDDLKQKADAIHLASAVKTNMDAFHTYDGASPERATKILALTGRITRADGNPLKIVMPDADAYGPLFGGTKNISGEEDPF